MPNVKRYEMKYGFPITFGSDLSGHLIKTGSSKIVIYSHGNGGNLTWYRHNLYKLAERIDAFIYDYPGYGDSMGFPSEESVKQSGIQAYDFVKSLGYKNIYLYGFSLGGAITTHIAANRKVDGIVLQSTFANISDCVPIIGKLVAGKNFKSIDNLKHIDCPLMVSHSHSDGAVPFSSAQKLYNEYNNEKYFYVLDTYGHNDVPLSSEYYDYIFNRVFV